MLKQIFKNLPYQSLKYVAFYSLIIVLVQLLPIDTKTWLEYNSLELTNSQSWRLITGHFVHTNWAHLAMNVAALFGLWSLHGQFYSMRGLFNQIMLSACLISASLYFLSDLQLYVGFSGVLHSLLIWGACKDIQTGEKTGYLLILGAFAKVIWEQIAGASAETAQMIQAPVAIDAHLAGVIVGLILFATERWHSPDKKIQATPANDSTTPQDKQN